MLRTTEAEPGLIEHFESYSFSGGDIKRILNSPVCKVIDYNEFDQVTDLLQALPTTGELNEPVYCLITLLTRTPEIRHWMSILVRPQDREIELYDPYGFNLQQELELARADSNALKYLLRDKISEGWRVLQSRTRLQKMAEGINTCGAHSITRCQLRDLRQSEFIRFIMETAHRAQLTTDELVIKRLLPDMAELQIGS